ncbi:MULTISPECIES: Crp/Fnr family transcriptional regulator [Thiorhodovibrio]|uniref:Crp/Fnr family transcriptional regulator n=1 Tax=Thiorhodovibrio TaxID=61593 RepID=UPI001912CF5A|nr:MULTISPECIES: Crp/Fnr family transcriptional regulator [Thiorhodovibrio]MBK5969537.1 Crp/Fnr family transcriptional regulator [Thiorhodovibrio winogradskyi]WPL11993.1 Catabolite activation-like protein [Thiorhodovibrio litoralis]
MSKASITTLHPTPARLSQVQRRLKPYCQVTELMASDLLDPTITRRCIGFVHMGQLQLTWRAGEDRNGLSMHAVDPGHGFGGNNWLFDEPPRTLYYQANRLTRVLTIEVEHLRTLLAEELIDLNQPLRDEMLHSYARCWLYLAERHHRAHAAPTEERLLDALHEAAAWSSAMSHPEGTLVKARREMLALRVGCARVTVSRGLARLVADGRVRLEGRRILLLGHQGRGEAA